MPIAGGIVEGCQTKLTDIDGMSGGPIFAIKWIDSQNIRYWVVAVQSSWLRSERILAACPILPLVNAIEQSIDVKEKEPTKDEKPESKEEIKEESAEEGTEPVKKSETKNEKSNEKEGGS